ncbi:cytochrome P450 71A9-like [Apium graveolens]|uniref:cytochrome P450 71A9-like n=1 Tax=Apium graveolens TaxID=4045 RepID=UPI003D7AE98F
MRKVIIHQSSSIMEVALFLLSVSLPLLLLIKLRSYYNRKLNRRPPGPRGLPWIGNLHQFDSINPHIYLYQLSLKYGPLMSLRLGSVQTLVISSASAAKEVFKNHDLCFSGRPTFVGSQKVSYNSKDIVFSPYNEYWRDMRKICNLHLFSSKRSESFQPVREQEVAQMVKTIRDGAAAADSHIVNLSKTLMTLTSSIMFRITFGKGYDDEDGAEKDNNMSSRFHWLLAESQSTVVSFFLTDYFPVIGRLIDTLSGKCGRLEKSFNALDSFYQQLIDEHLRASTEYGQYTSILEILLQMKKDSREFMLDHVKAILSDVIVAASDSSAAAVVWAMTLLIKSPSTMKKAQQEVRELTGKKGFVDENDVQKLVYLKAVVKEAMRLNPIAPLLVPKETIEKCVINGYEIKAKTLVYVNVHAIGRDPESWEDPNEFLPERFINSSIDFKGQDFELIPFGVGRRICPGITMGVATTELALANLLYSFNWELPSGMKKEDIDMDTLPGITMHKKNHLCLVPQIVN